MSRTARVTFSYVAEQGDELTLKVGDIITNIEDVDVGWCRGELEGKKGMFPNNFVEEVVVPSEPVSDSVAGMKAKVTFDYEAQDQDELTLALGNIVHVLGEEEPGWWRGQLANKTGVFPSNFVEIIADNNVGEAESTPMPKKLSGEETVQHPSPTKEATRNEHVDGLNDEDIGIKRSSSIGAAAKKLPGGGMGFGNLINPNILAEKKLRKVQPDDKRESKGKTEEPYVPNAEPSKPSAVNKTKAPLSAKSRPAPPVPLTSPVKKPSERAKVTFAYEPENPDELRLVEGDVVTILNKDIAESDGWWEGELNGKVGMFPNNFVMVLPPEEDEKAPVPVATGKKDIPVLPFKEETKKSPSDSDSDATQEQAVSPGRPDKKPSHPTAKEPPPVKNAVPPHPSKGESDHSTELVRPTLGKKPMAPQKPSLPPKKPLPPKTKKPDVAPKKAEKKVDSDKSAAAKKSVDDKEFERDEIFDVKEAPKDEADGKPIPEIKTESVAEAPVSFEDVPQTETLNHLTANRAKHPQKRPPSKEGRSTNSSRLSGNLEEEVAETIKQPPGRPKEPSKEPDWKREVREAREKKQALDEKAPPPVLAPKSDAVEKRRSIHKEEAQPGAVPVQKVEPFSTGTAGEVEKLRKEVSALREMLSKMEKKQSEMMRKLQEEFFREIESLTNDLDEEKKKNAAQHAAHKVELDRLKRRQARFSIDETP